MNSSISFLIKNFQIDVLLLNMDLEFILNKLEIHCYSHRLMNAGFDTWDVVKDITEADM